MNINDYFKKDSSYIINNFNAIDFDENERSIAKFLKDSIDYFQYINCYEIEKFISFEKVSTSDILGIINDDMNPLILARLYTYLYLNNKEDKYHNACNALRNYEVAFNQCDSFEYKCSCVNKIISITRQFKINDKNEIIKKYLKELLLVEREEQNAFDFHILKNSYEYKVIDFNECISICKIKINEYYNYDDEYFDFAIEISESAVKNGYISNLEKEELIRELHLIKAYTYEIKGDNDCEVIRKNHFYEISLKTLKDISYDPYSLDFKRIKEKLEQSQIELISSMNEYTEEFNISGFIGDVSRRLESCNGIDFLNLIMTADFNPKKDQQIEEVKKMLDDSISLALFPINNKNHQGKTISKLRSLPIVGNVDDKIKEDIILEHAYHSVNMLAFIRGQYIHRLILMVKEKCTTLSKFIEDVVEKSYIVPKSRKNIVIKGLKYGLDFELESAIGILVPQIENCIRELAGICGEVKYKIDDGFIESANGLEFLLRKDGILMQSLDEDIYFGLCSIFSNEFGLNFRNEFCHGLIESFNTYVSIYVWWFCLYFINIYS